MSKESCENEAREIWRKCYSIVDNDGAAIECDIEQVVYEIASDLLKKEMEIERLELIVRKNLDDYAKKITQMENEYFDLQEKLKAVEEVSRMLMERSKSITSQPKLARESGVKFLCWLGFHWKAKEMDSKHSYCHECGKCFERLF